MIAPTPDRRWLVADIGGTRARFALSGGDAMLADAAELAVADHATALAAIDAYLAGIGRPALAGAALAIAAPVVEGEVQLTNAGWRFDRQQLAARLQLADVMLLNDFTALAWSLPGLAAGELRQVGGGAPAVSAALAVLGPGTGLGVSGLLPHGDGWVPLAGEGGHVTLAASDAREAAILALARAEYAHVSAERLVSGPGLPLLHRLVCAVDGLAHVPMTAAELVAAAVAGDDLGSAATIDTFAALLGNVAGNLALTLGARGGVYLGGGIVPRLGARFDATPFRQRFAGKGRFQGYLAAIPAYVILSPAAALLGAARALAAQRAAHRRSPT